MTQKEKQIKQFKYLFELHNLYVEKLEELMNELEGSYKSSLIRYKKEVQRSLFLIKNKVPTDKQQKTNVADSHLFTIKNAIEEPEVEEVVAEDNNDSSVIADTGSTKRTKQEVEEAKESARKKSRLSKADKAIVIDYHSKGMTAEEIAEKQNYSLKAVNGAIAEAE